MPAEVSPFNPAARRETGGIRNDRKLPVTEWEIAEQRVVLPADLQLALDIPVLVLRWDRENYLTVMRQHARDIHVVEGPSTYLTR